MAKYDSYVICTSPRSGSTLLCDMLTASGVAGNPDSYFHRPSIADWLDGLSLAPVSAMPERQVLRMIFRAAMTEGSLKTGMFGLRLQRDSFDFFIQKLAVLHPKQTSDVERFRAAFGPTSFIHLTRLDKIEQAVSLVKARQTGLWHRAPDGTELERLSPPREPVYDTDEIQAGHEELSALDHEWKTWFARESVTPLRITYEALSADPIGILRRVLGHLGLDRVEAQDVKPGVAKLADEVSRNWVARFRAEVEVPS